MTRLRLAFLGSPDFAVPALRALHAAGHDIAAVFCQPPRPAGRGQAVRPCPVHAAAQSLDMTVRTPTVLRRDEVVQAEFAALDLDAAVVAAYGLILPPAMLDAPKHGCLNIHASLLPRWRGAAPIQAAIRGGDSATGITIMRMDAGLDTGPMLLRESVPITADTTASMLHDTLAALGSRLILRALAEFPAPTPQPEEGATYAPKLTRADGRIDWSRPADDILRQVRALNPWPGTFTALAGTTIAGTKLAGTTAGQVLKILAAAPAEGNGPPGTVLAAPLTVACGTGAIRLTRLQLPGRAALDAAAFVRGHPVPTGTCLS